MKDDDALPVSTPTSSSFPGMLKKENYSVVTSLFGRIRYKFWALAAILLLAFWSMLTGTASLRRSTGNLSRFDLDYESPAAEDLDVLEREKLVKHMWDVYTNNPRIGLGDFWREAFVAAYEVLTSEESEDRETAISEIARMSIRHLPFLHSSSSMVNLSQVSCLCSVNNWCSVARAGSMFLVMPTGKDPFPSPPPGYKSGKPYLVQRKP
ncbi:hypothetical protein ACS0TY_029099 [Phlomoides rotata]